MRGATAAGGDPNQARPMTSNRGAGYSSLGPRAGSAGRSALGGSAAGAMLRKSEAITPAEQARDLERRVHQLLEESAALTASGRAQDALEKALEARRKERALTKFLESNSLADQINVDLTFAIDFSLAATYAANKMYDDALREYTAIVKNRALPHAGRLRVNMGNIYFEQKKYTSAIKMYRMALDQVPPTASGLRFKIMRSIGVSFVRMGQFKDAHDVFLQVMVMAVAVAALRGRRLPLLARPAQPLAWWQQRAGVGGDRPGWATLVSWL